VANDRCDLYRIKNKPFIEHGFSGGGVFESRRSALVGIVCDYDQNPNRPIARMIPTDGIRESYDVTPAAPAPLPISPPKAFLWLLGTFAVAIVLCAFAACYWIVHSIMAGRLSEAQADLLGRVGMPIAWGCVGLGILVVVSFCIMLILPWIRR